MLNRNLFFLSFLVLFFASCSNQKKPSILWGETEYYNDFLFVKHAPDTLKKSICFNFNEDAKLFMQEHLQLGVFRKNAEGEFIQLTENEIEIFIDGIKIDKNIIEVPASASEMEIGFVLSKELENKTHYWFIKAIQNGGLDRINGNIVSEEDADIVLDIQLIKKHIMNPLVKGILVILIVFLILLLFWFLIFKTIFYPTFKVNRIDLIGPEPYINSIRIKRYRQLVLTSKPVKQGFISKLFTGKIKYSINTLWTAEVVFEPKDKRSIRISPNREEYLVDARILKINTECTLENIKTKTKTKIKVF